MAALAAVGAYVHFVFTLAFICHRFAIRIFQKDVFIVVRGRAHEVSIVLSFFLFIRSFILFSTACSLASIYLDLSYAFQVHKRRS